MKEIKLVYHYEPPGWWAESPDLARYYAAGQTLDEVRSLAKEGLKTFCPEPFVVSREDLFVEGQEPMPIFRTTRRPARSRTGLGA